jgi:transcriptional regulator with XRE-family HTH domain
MRQMRILVDSRLRIILNSIVLAKSAAEIRTRRKTLRLSQAQVSFALGVPQPTFCNWENGVGNLRPEVVAEVESYLDREELRLVRALTSPDGETPTYCGLSHLREAVKA